MVEAEFTVEDRRLSWAELPAPLAPLLDYWQRKRGTRRMPARRDIDPAELGPVLGRVALIQVNPGAPRFVIRVWGSEITHRPHGPRDRKPVSEVRPRRLSEVAERHYELACASGEPTLHELTLRFREHHATHRRIALPLAADGRNPDMLLIGSVVDQRRLDPLFEAYFTATGET